MEVSELVTSITIWKKQIYATMEGSVRTNSKRRCRCMDRRKLAIKILTLDLDSLQAKQNNFKKQTNK